MKSENKNLAVLKNKKRNGTIDKKYVLIFLCTILVICILIGLNEIFDVPNLLRGEKTRPVDWIEFIAELSAILLMSLSSIFLLKKAELKRKRGEEALRESEERFRQLAENIDQVFWLTDWENNKLLYVNPSYEKLFGRSCQSAYDDRLNWYQVIHPDDRAPVRESLVQNAKLGQSTEVEYRIVRDDGTMRWILDRNYPIRDQHGEVYRIVSIAEDITERKRAEEALRESEGKYRALIEAAGRAGEGIIIIQDSGEGEAAFVFVNDQFCRMSGYSREELLGRSPWDLVPHEISVRLIDWYKRRHMGESLPGHYEAAGVHKDGTIVPLELSIVTMPWQGKIATVLYLRDITERKRMEEEAIEHTKNVEYLSKTAMGLMELPAQKDIYRFIGEQLRELIGDAIYILVNSFDQRTRQIQPRAFLADDQYRQVVLKTLGTDPMGMSFVVSEEAWNGLISGKLVRVPGGIHELSFGEIPKAACDALEKLAGTGSIYVMGFTEKGELYGSATIIMREGCELSNHGVTETFMRQAGVALQRKRAEEALRESEERFRQLAENIDQVFWLTDWENNKLLYVNPSYEKLFGRSCQSAYDDRLNWYQVIHPDDRAPVRESLVQNAKLGQSTEVEYRIVRDDGKMRWILDRNYPIRDQHGEVYRIVSIAEDITERKRAEQALRESEERLKLVLEGAELGTWDQNMKTGEVVRNHRWAEMLGYTLEEIDSHADAWKELIHPDDLPVVNRIAQDHEAGRTPFFKCEHRMRTKSGEWKWILNCGKIIQWDSDGKPVRATGTHTDITDRKRAEEALRASEYDYRSLMEQASDGIFISYGQGNYIDVNRAACEMLGYTHDELLHLSTSRIVHPEDLAAQPLRWDELHTGKVILIERRLIRKDGTTIPVEITARMLEDGRFLALVRDITERQRAEEQIAYQAQLLAIVNDAVVASDAQYRLTALNAAAESMYGWKAEEVLGWFGLDITRTEFPGVDKAEMLRAIAERGSWRGEATQARKDGTRFPVEVSSVVLRDATGKVTGFVSVNRDITERKKAEEALRKSEEKYRTLVETAQEGIGITDLNENVVFANQAFADMLGYNKDELLGLNLSQISDKEVFASFREETQKRQRGESSQYEAKLFTKTGESRYFSISASPISDDQGTFMGTMGLLTDITQRKQAEEALKKERQRLFSVLDVMPTFVYLQAPDYSVRFINRRFRELFGDPGDRPCYEAFYGRKEPCDPCITLRVLETRAPQTWEWTSKEGRTYMIREDLFPSKDDEDLVLEIGVDITERKQAEDSLRTSEAQLSNAMKIAKLGYWEYDVAKDLFTFNDHFYAIFRTTAEQVGGYTMSSARYAELFVHPDDMSAVGIEIHKAIETIEPHYSRQLEHRIIYGDGEIGHIAVRFFVVKDSQGRTVMTYGVNQDITERKQMEEVIRKSEEKWRSLVNNAPNMIIIVNRDSTIQFINRTVSPLTIEETIGKSIYDYIEPEHHNVVRETIEHVLQTGEPGSYEIRGVGPQGYSSWYETQVGPIKHDEQIVAVTLIITDITERKQAEELLKKSEAKNRAILKAMPDSMFRITKDGIFLEAMPAKDLPVYMFPPEFAGMSVYQIIPEIAKQFMPGVKKALETNEIQILEYQLPLQGEMRHHEARIVPSGKDEVLSIVRDITERKKTEESLRESEDKYRTLFEKVPVGIAMSTIEGKIIDLNKAQAEMIGCTVKELQGRSVNDYYVYPDKRKEMIEVFKKIGKVRDFEMQLRRKDGSIITESLNLDQVHLGGKNLLFATGRDITERKRAEEAIKEERDYSKNLIETAQTIIMTLDTEGRIVNFNRYMEELSGYKLIEVKGKDWFTTFLPKCDHDRIRNIFKEAIGDIQTKGNINPILTKEGREVIVEWYDKTLKDSKGKITGLLAIGQDITERKRAEDNLRLSEEIFAKAFNASPSAVFMTTLKEGRFVEINKTGLDMFGYKPDEIVGRTIKELGLWVDLNDRATLLGRLQKEGIVRNMETSFRRKSGEVFATIISVDTVDIGGKQFLLSTCTDITERKKMEAQLIQAERLSAVGTLAYGIAHEFNNILAGILGNAEFGLITNDPKEVKECFQIIQENCERAKSITSHLLAFSRRREAKKQRADITDAVESVLGLVERELEKQNIKVGRKFNPVPEIVCDLGELSEVALNMITNARDAMKPKGGMLTIEIGKKGDNIEMIFTDTGGGIPDSIKGRIFEPFVTTKGALGQSDTPGTGLGLFLSYGIISRYQGRIEVKSEVGKGSQFIIKIPISKNQRLPISIKVKEDEPVEVPQNLNILLVDDEKPILSSLKKFLEAKGHLVVTSPSGKKGLQLFKNKVFDLVLSDITMPDMDGIKLISKFKSIDKDVKLIVLTGHLAEEKLNSARKAGADQVLTKPFKNEELYKAIGRVLAI